MKNLKDKIGQVIILEIEDEHDVRDTRPDHDRWFHLLEHSMGGWVMVQVWSGSGELLPVPGVGRTPEQLPDQVLIPVLNPHHYPLRVVMIG